MCTVIFVEHPHALFTSLSLWFSQLVNPFARSRCGRRPAGHHTGCMVLRAARLKLTRTPCTSLSGTVLQGGTEIETSLKEENVIRSRKF